MKGESAVQVDKLVQIADYLRAEREKQGISLEEIAIKTFIPQRLLQALDEGHIERLPEPVFVQGFIRRYADSLGLDGTEIAKTFPVEAPPTDPKPAEPEVSATPSPITTKEPIAAFTPAPISDRTSSSSGFPLPYVVGGVAAALVLGLGAFSLFNRPQVASAPQPGTTSNSTASNNSTNLSAPVSPTPSVQASVSPVPSASPSPTASSEPAAQGSPLPGSGVEVAVDARDGDSWMEVVVDGKTEFEGTLKQGTQKTWTAKEKLSLISGNAGAVYITYNQGAEQKLGKLGEVKEMTFPLKTETPNQETPNPINPSPSN